MGILAVTACGIILLLVVRLAKGRRPVIEKPVRTQTESENEMVPPDNESEGITQEDIINYFLNLFRHQIGATPEAPMSAKLLAEIV